MRWPTKPTGQRRKRSGEMNKLEAAYSRRLDLLKSAGEVLDFWWESSKWRLADRTWYTPDFMVLRPDGGVEMHETKGFMQDDAAVKLKVFAEMYPFRTFLVKRVAKKDGEWEITPV